MLDIYNQMKAEKMHSGVRLALVGWGTGSFNRRSRTAQAAWLHKNPRYDLFEGLVLLMKPWQGHGGTAPKRSRWSHVSGEALQETSRDPPLGKLGSTDVDVPHLRQTQLW